MTDDIQELITRARPEVLEGWSNRLLEELDSVEVVTPPRPALIMLQSRDSVRRERFCVGELLVMECRLHFNKENFWGRVIGNEPVRAVAAALFKIAEKYRPDVLRSLEEAFREERSLLEESDKEVSVALGTTMVRFDTMTQT